MRYKTTRLLKKTSMYRSRYVYDRHYLPTAVCLTYALPVSVLQQGPTAPCIFFSNMKSIKKTVLEISKEKNNFFLQMEPSKL